MKLSIDRSALSEVLARGGSLSPRVGTIPILFHVRLVAKDGVLHVSTTDLDIQAVATAEVEITAPGATTVNARALADFVAKLPSGVTKISMEEDPKSSRLAVKASPGRNKALLPTLPAGDFPDLTLLRDGAAVSFEVSGKDLDRLFGRTAVAISTEETRYYLNGTFLHVAGAELRAVATDGHILLRTSIVLPGECDAGRFPKGSQHTPGVIVPRAAAAAALKLFGREPAVRVSISVNGIAFEAGVTRIVSKLIDGTFPDCDRVIPSANPHKVSLDRGSCLSALGLVEVFHTKDSGNALECGIDAEGLAMASGGGDGEGDGFAVAAAEFDGAVPNFGVSSRYLRSVLGAFSADVVTLRLDDPGSPIHVSAENEGDVLGVIMPMRVTRSRLARMGAAQ